MFTRQRVLQCYAVKCCRPYYNCEMSAAVCVLPPSSDSLLHTASLTPAAHN